MIKWWEKHNKISWLITILIAITIFYLSTLTFESTGTGTGNKSVIYHIAIFFIFAGFLLISAIKGKRKSLIPLVIITAIVYGVLDEFHQYFVPGRFFSVYDIVLNILGIVTASTIYLAIMYKRQQTL